jgi:uncharacterized protein with von Willebrand factor type A (vWA) domain
MATWIRKSFESPGITQVPHGPHVRDLQSRFSGVAILMIDVSGSMNGRPIREAVAGAQEFVREAAEAHYHVGVMLWNTVVVAQSPPALDPRPAQEVLERVRSAAGGNALHGPLCKCHCILKEFAGDRVVALFGDGDLSPKPQVLRKVAEMKADDIRFVTRGLGADAAREFAQISDEDPASVAVESVEQLATGIASMAISLKRSNQGRR